MVHHERPRLSPTLVPNKISRPEGRAVVGGRRLDVEFAEGSVRTNLSVRHAVHRATAGQTQTGRFGPLPKTVENVKRASFVDCLERVSNIFMTLRQRLLRPAGRTEQ